MEYTSKAEILKGLMIISKQLKQLILQNEEIIKLLKKERAKE